MLTIKIKLKQLMCMHYVSDTARYFLIEKGENVSSYRTAF